jgi:hypothetical protein
LCASVLCSARSAWKRIDAIEAFHEASFEASPHRTVDFKVESIAKEVVGARVFVEPANQIADGVDKLFLAAGRGVEEHVADEFDQGAALMVGHAFEHFELHVIDVA